MFFQFRLKMTSSQEQALTEARSHGLTSIYVIEEINPLNVIIGGSADAAQLPTMQHLEIIEPLSTIDWQQQSREFSPYYKEGIIEIPLADFSCNDDILRMHVGNGFGDMSHPTTHLALQLLSPYVEGRAVLDVGCGNGVLSFAAKMLGAKFVSAIDIDPEAIEHSRANQSFNRIMDIDIGAIPSPRLQEETKIVCVMNMTFFEQKDAFASIGDLNQKIDHLITSGILLQQKDLYLDWLCQRGFIVERELEKQGWLGFICKKKAEIALL